MVTRFVPVRVRPLLLLGAAVLLFAWALPALAQVTPVANLSIQKAGPSTVTRGDQVNYGLLVSNAGPDTAFSVVVTDPIPAGLTFNEAASDADCNQVGSNVVCTLGDGPSGTSRTLDLFFDAPTIANCSTTTVQNTAVVTSQSTDNSMNDNTSQTISTDLLCPAQFGCIDILKEVFDQNDNFVTPIPTFTFMLDGVTSTTNNVQGFAHYANVTPGVHTVTEILPQGWSSISVTPPNGQLTVLPGTDCAGIIFKNRQPAASLSANLSITKTGASTVTRGNQLSYSLVVSNAGPNTASGVIVTDPVPAGLTFNDAASDAACDQVGSNVVCTIGNGPMNQSRTINLVFDVPTVANCSAAQVSNTATVTSQTTDPSTSNNTSQTVTTTVQCPAANLSANLGITKSGPSTVTRGNQISYTLLVNNAGPNTASGVVVTDPVPAGLTYNDAASDSACDQVGSNVVCTIGNGPANQNRTITLVFDVPTVANCTASQVSNVAAVTSQTTDPSAGNNVSQTVVTDVQCPAAQTGCIEILKEVFDTNNNQVTPVPVFTFALDNGPTVQNGSNGSARFDNVPVGTHTVSETLPSGWSTISITPTGGHVTVLAGTDCAGIVFKNRQPAANSDVSVTKSGPSTVVRGNQITYSLLVTNSGPATATDVVVTDAIPTGLTYNDAASDSACDQVGNNVVCTIGNGGAGQSRSISLVFDVPTIANCTTSQISNVATVTTSSPDNATSNNTSQTVTTQVQCPAPLESDLNITKSGPQTVTRGGQITYSLLISNLGPAAATNVVVRDAIPTGLTYNAGLSDAACTQQGNEVVCAIGSGNAGQSRTINLIFDVPTVANCSASQVTNVATVTSSSTDSHTSNNISSVVTTQVQCPQAQVGCIEILKEVFDTNNNQVTPVPVFTFNLDTGATTQNTIQGAARFDNVPVGTHTVSETLPSGWSTISITPTGGHVTVLPGTDCAGIVFKNRQPAGNSDISITKSGPQTVTRGGQITYNLLVTNNGPATATDVVVRDNIPTGLTYNAAASDSACTQQGNQIVCSIGNGGAGQSRPITLVFDVPTLPAQNCVTTQITNIATVTTTAPESTTGNNTSQTVTTTVQCPAPQTGCVEILKEVFDSNNNQISNIPAFTFQLDNGPTTQNGAQGFARFDNVPVGTHVVTETLPSGWSQILVTPNGGHITVTEGPDCVGIVFKNRQPQENADLSVIKTGFAEVLRGNQLTYTITVTNNGPATAQNVVVRDVIPNGLVYNANASDPACMQQGNEILCNIGSGAAGQSRVISLVFDVPVIPNCTPVQVTNRASVMGSTNDQNQSNNLSQVVTTTLLCPVPTTTDLSVTKSGPSSVLQGDQIQYALVVTNNGPAVATGVIVSDIIPAGLTYLPLASDQSCTFASGVVTCSIGTLAVGQPRPIALTFATQAPATPCKERTINNRGTVYGAQSDPVSSNNISDVVTTQLLCPTPTTADLSITKSGASIVQRGNRLTYTITVTNNGPAVAQNVVVRDPIPAGITYVDSASDNTCDLQGNDVVCTIGNGASGQTRVITLAFDVPTVSGVCTPATVLNSATVQSQTTDPVSSNNLSALVTTQVTCPVPQPGCIEIIKETFDTNGNVQTPVAQFTFTLDGNQTTVNLGNGLARFDNVTPGTHTVTEQIASGWSQMSVTPANGTLTVLQGPSCATVVFKNKQLPPPPPEVGCIEIIKEGFDGMGNRIGSLPGFTFTLDNGRSVTSDSAGRARFDNVSPGSHVVTEGYLANWTQILVTPLNGQLQVSTGAACAGIVFKNRQTPAYVPPSSTPYVPVVETPYVPPVVTYPTTSSNSSGICDELDDRYGNLSKYLKKLKKKKNYSKSLARIIKKCIDNDDYDNGSSNSGGSWL